VLLSDPEVARLINTETVPAWESVRPVPKVTIDFGDGRKLQRTLGGNTVMYLCLPDGRVVDAFPGVYTPRDFVLQVRPTLEMLKTLQGSGERACAPGAADTLREWHRQQAALAVVAEQRRITLSKAFVESPLLNALASERGPVVMPAPAAPVPGPAAQVAAPANAAVVLSRAPDPNLVRDQKELFRDRKEAFRVMSRVIEDVSKHPASIQQLKARYAATPEGQRPSPEELGRLAVELDSRTNLTAIRPAVHLLFSTCEEPPQSAQARDTIYRDLLHTPLDDPYLGLADALVPGTRR
jgi:hypothetical protein